MADDTNEKKHDINQPAKSSMEILSELFSTFDAEPPVIVKKEKKVKSESSKKHKKSKKKHKHKHKKHKKKSKKRKRSCSSSSCSSSDSAPEIDLAQLLIKQEKNRAEKKIKIEGTEISVNISATKTDSDKTATTSKKVHSVSEESRSKIIIKDLKYSSIFEAALNETKVVRQSETEESKKRKHKNGKRERSRSRSKSKEKKSKSEDLRSKIKGDHIVRDSRSKHRSRDRDFYKSRDKSRDKKTRDYKDDSKSRDDYKYDESRTRKDNKYKDDYGKSLEEYKRSRHTDTFYKEYKEKDEALKSSRDRDEKWFMRDRYRGYSERDKHSERSRSSENTSSRIDKKKLLEIARRNAITMMKSGSLPGALQLGPHAQEKVIAAIKSGGKTVEELTDFCKTLSKKEELGELSSLSEKDDSENEEPFHHPFQLKDRPTSITMNIKNSVPLPIKSTQERSTELRIQFPVSSGQQHRKNEEWIPVPSTQNEKKEEKSIVVVPQQPIKAIEAPPEPSVVSIAAVSTEIPASVAASQPVVVPAPPNAPPGPQVYPTPMLEQSVDIGSIVSQRLTAMRKLQENPHDVQALTQMYKSNQEMKCWAESKQQFGQFTGSTGAPILSQAELASGYQAWAKKGQLTSAAPVSGGMGMHLLQKMGWKPGEGLGKEKTGALEPLLLEVKLDKKGLVANEEQPQKNKKKVKGQPTVKSLQGKHPVSILGEYASKRKLGAPQYILEFECGPDHKKNFLFKVILNGMEYKPNVASNNKKEAKANAATLALQQIGLLP